MATELLTEKYADNLHGVLNCYDRVLVTGHVQQWCYARAMTSYLYQHEIRIFDYTKFAQPLRESVRANAEAIAKENGVEIEFVRRSKHFRKEKRIKMILKERGDHPGLVHIFSAMESCPAYRPWHDKPTGKTYVKSTSGKCLHYYFYFINEELGLCFLRVPTWAPFRLQFYFNGHNWLASQLKQKEIGFELQDNAFLKIDDFEVADQIAAQFDIEQLHAKLDSFARQYCPVMHDLNLQYNWSIMQAEYATDLVFKRQSTLQAFYPRLLETLIQAVKPVDIATFLGQKLHGNYQGEMGNRFNVRWLGSRIRHQMGPVSIKMYDKFNIVLRIEPTVNQVSFFKQYRQVNHRDGSTSMRWAPMKKTIYSLSPLQETLLAANQRYLKFISEIDTPEVGVKKLHRLAETKEVNHHRHKGFNLFSEEDISLFRTLLRGEFFISGFTNKDLRQLLSNKNSGQITRLLKRLRVHGLIKKVGRTYKYYLTEFGRQVVVMALKLREMMVIPELAQAYPAQV
ncbi:MAG: MarR family transcriptional regulator [Bacteroidetes bacterium]|nr:MarR family transcriptional regulator [Bacteroidota bacterium]